MFGGGQVGLTALRIAEAEGSVAIWRVLWYSACSAHQSVAEHAEYHSALKWQRGFRFGGAQSGHANLAAAKQVMASQQREERHPARRPDCRSRPAPDPQHAQRLQAAARPRHDHQHIAGEDLRAADQHQAEADGEDQPGENPGDAERQRAPAPVSAKFEKIAPKAMNAPPSIPSVAG